MKTEIVSAHQDTALMKTMNAFVVLKNLDRKLTNEEDVFVFWKREWSSMKKAIVFAQLNTAIGSTIRENVFYIPSPNVRVTTSAPITNTVTWRPRLARTHAELNDVVSMLSATPPTIRPYVNVSLVTLVILTSFATEHRPSEPSSPPPTWL